MDSTGRHITHGSTKGRPAQELTRILTQEQRRNAQRFINALSRDGADIPDIMPDMGPLLEHVEPLLDVYREGGAEATRRAIRGLSVDHPFLLDLKKESKYRSHTIDEIFAQPDQEWILEGLFLEDTIGSHYGPSGAGKSFVTLDQACHLALGWNWKGRQVRQCYVIYLAAEGARGYKRRLRAWIYYHAQLLNIPQEQLLKNLSKNLAIVPLALPLANVAEVNDFIDTKRDELDARTNKLPVFIILDTLFQCAAGQDVNKSEVMTGIVSTAMRIKEELAASNVLIIHHTGKDKSRGPTGNASLKGCLDEVFNIDATEDGLITLSSAGELGKVKDGEDVTMYLQRVRIEYGPGKLDNSCVVVETERPARPAPGAAISEKQQTILDALPTNAPGLLSSAIEDATGIVHSTVTYNLKALVQSGKVAIYQENTPGRKIPMYYKTIAESEAIRELSQPTNNQLNTLVDDTKSD